MGVREEERNKNNRVESKLKGSPHLAQQQIKKSISFLLPLSLKEKEYHLKYLDRIYLQSRAGAYLCCCHFVE